MEQIEAMSPVQGRLNLLGFLAVAGLIAANALYFQDPSFSLKSRLMPTKTTESVVKINPSAVRVQEEKRVLEEKKELPTQAIPAEKVEKPEEPKKVQESAPAELVKAIQRELKARGYFPGTQDGAPGLVTRAAILAFEYDMGLPLTAMPSDQVLQMIIFGAPERSRTGVVDEKISESGREVVKVVQKVLHDLGYAAGNVNGIMSRETQNAIREFETDRKLKVTGRISGQLVHELVKVTDVPTGG